MKSTLIFLCSALLAGKAFAVEATPGPTLQSAFAGKFVIGAAIDASMTKPGHPAHQLLLQQFNSITPTNLLKWAPYNPQPGVFNEEPAEAYFAFGAAHNDYVVAHNLFWHQQTPQWVFEDGHGGEVSREVLLHRMRERVRHLAQRYGSRMNACDVVNEAFLDNGPLRPSPYSKILGTDFLPEAFRIAQEELPASVKLLYNDYSLETPAKAAAVVNMVQRLRTQGLRIDAVGNQAHWLLDAPTIPEIETSLRAFKAAGVKVHFTELDIEVLPRRVSGADINARAALTPENNPFPNGLPPELQQKLAQRYAEIFTLFLKYSDVIERVTFWGVTDADSWLNNWPVRGRTNYPLLFDRASQPKPAFAAVLRAAGK